MDRSGAISQLPAMHAVAIRLQEGGFDEGVIATALGTEPEQVPPLLQIAATKLASLLAQDDAAPIAPPIDRTQQQQQQRRGG